MVMLFVSLLRWWYSDGWVRRARLISNQLDGVIDYFSIDLLLKTLFSPFRQISAGKVNGPLEAQMRALADKLISRIIGAMIRLILLTVGLIAIAGQVIIGLITLILWALLPVFPIIGLVLMFTGWTF
jgi:hypothetical protein